MRVLSGIQPTGSIHIGNYLGAIKQWVELQEKEDCIFFIADLHSLTAPYKPVELQKNILETAIAYLALGIDPQKSIFFVQSDIKEHTELCWLLNTICPLGELERMTQFKEKSKQFKKDINAGLLTYPVLQAADILLYKTDAVPVGKDQVQHVELTRTIARKFNQKFGKLFPEPKALLPKFGAKIMDLNNPKKKMSKSLGPQGYISVFEQPEEVEKKIMSAVTDTGKQIKYNQKGKPGISNLLIIYSLFSGKSIKELEKEFKGRGYAQFKKSLAELLIKSLEPFQRKRKEFLARKIYVEETLKLGAKRAQSIAESTLSEARQKMGLN
ncbi:MAG: tryptophan--tRNA ligase [Candidatus Nealsonbacteria bacterium RBG_13_37_56]|uniref:Tryptophan--tRNA ligase n=1 Tax=Candidatus Nealsonbacteria bacterium RBG_13_37_56 TaxID=1801661 RepID=A0A1G2DWC5_9BACT|nr:MAG: tryptophan--tRNA ligase [Candidatus Nealsonbacteria bacterium RBG_13_37_56]